MRSPAFLPILLTLVAVLAVAAPARAQIANDRGLFAVADVVADITADSAAHARDQAIVAAQRSALEQVLERLGADPSLAHKADDDTVASLVENFEVDGEHSSAVRYIGIYTVQFRPGAVRQWLAAKNVAFKESTHRPILVLPVFVGGDHPVLWEQPTRWRTTWENAEADAGSVPIVVPSGGLGDIALLGTNDAMGGNAGPLKALIDKYKANGTAVAVLASDPAQPGATLKINVYLYDENGAGIGKAISLSLAGAADSDTVDAALAGAVRTVRQAIESDWLQAGAQEADQDNGQNAAPATYDAGDNNPAGNGPPAPDDTGVGGAAQNSAAQAGAPTDLQVTVPTATPADWQAIKLKLDRVPSIEHANIVAMTRGATSIDLAFHGPVVQLQGVLAAQQLSLTQDALSGGWILQSAVGPAL
ncbi:MAG TPA: DUF2066 domain-containing protein [Alphaproteobacteria bacterium]|nr:DUF2066 domain-containing protein [Alphaproteobacteria bacterium]